MLTAEQIAALRDKAGQLVDPVVEFLIGDIAERISEAGQLTSTAAYEVWKAQKLGLSQKQLKKELSKRLKVSSGEIEQLLTQAAEVGYEFDISRFPTVGAIPFAQNESLQQILSAAVEMAQEDLTNITQTMGFVTHDGVPTELTEAYRKSCDFAFEKVMTGAQDYNSAIREATRGLAQKGILALDYESGVHRSLEAAVRGNIMGGLGLMDEKINQHNHDALGCDGWEISAHHGSAPDHEPIQGKQYPDAEYRRLNNSLLRRIGMLNCGHDSMGVILGVNEPQHTEEQLEQMRQENERGITYEGKHYTLYEATQRQRRIETAMRNQKRKILIDEKTGDRDKLQADQIRLVTQRAEYKRFSEAAGLPMQHERAEVAGFTWKHGKAAEKTAKGFTSDNRISSPQKGGGYSSNTHFEDGWDSNMGSKSWTAERRRSMYNAERDTVNKKYEIARLFNSDGKELFKKDGGSGAVRFTSTEIKQMRDGVLTHNHPNGSCFSPEDINMLRRGKLSEIRAVTSQGIYRLQKPASWKKSISSLEKIEEVYYAIDKEISMPIYAQAYRGEITYPQADAMSQEAVIREFGKRYGMNFGFDSWDTIGRGIE